MSKKMLLTLANALSITALTPAAPTISLNETPFLGGQGRSAMLLNNQPVGGAGVVSIQGNPGVVGSDGMTVTAPVYASAGWTDVAVLVAASPLQQEIEMPRYIRVNVTTIGTGTVTIALEGVQ